MSNGGPAITAEAVVAALRAHEAELRAAGLRSLSIFGSVARGEAGEGSDVDLAAEIERDGRVTLLTLVRLEERLAEILGRPVDLVTEPIRRDRLRERVERDRVRAY